MLNQTVIAPAHAEVLNRRAAEGLPGAPGRSGGTNMCHVCKLLTLRWAPGVLSSVLVCILRKSPRLGQVVHCARADPRGAAGAPPPLWSGYTTAAPGSNTSINVSSPSHGPILWKQRPEENSAAPPQYKVVLKYKLAPPLNNGVPFRPRNPPLFIAASRIELCRYHSVL